MIEEDHHNRIMCSNNSSGGGDGSGSGSGGVTRSSSTPLKRLMKQRKPPQRGLGVAQLEKIRIEQQKNKNNNNVTTCTPISSTNSLSSKNTIIPLPNYTNTNDQTFSKPVVLHKPSPRPPESNDLYSQNTIFRTSNSLPIITNSFQLNSSPSPNFTNVDGLQVGWPSQVPVDGNFTLPIMWNPSSHDSNKEENSILSLPYETCDIAHLPSVLPRDSTTQFQPHPFTCSMVNVSSMKNSSPLPVLNFPMEPPSNQRLHCNYSSFMWPDDGKVATGMKRSCPFPQVDSFPIPTFQNKFVPSATYPLNQTDELTIGGMDCSIPIFRDIHSYPSTISEQGYLRKINRTEHGHSHIQEPFNLAPTTFAPSYSNVKQACRIDNLSYQVNIKETLVDSRKGDSTSQHSNLFNFFPPTNQQATTSLALANTRSNGELEESIDLNLKL